MTTLREAAQQALEALCLWATGRDMDAVALNDLILRLEAALAEPTVPSDCTDSHQPVGWFEGPFGEFRANPLHRIAWPAQTVAWSIPLFLAPPQRKPLAEVDLRALYDRHAAYQEEGPEASGWWNFARAIERAHGIGEKDDSQG